MKKITLMSLTVLATTLVGCSTIDNRSLEYKKAQQLAPLNVPAGVMREPTPLYPAPIIEQQALQNAPRYANERGNRYQLPRPVAASQTAVSAGTALTPLRPQMIFDSSKNPLLQIGGDTATILRYIEATLSSLNYNSRHLGNGVIAIEKDGVNYLLNLHNVGATHVLGVYDAKGAFAPQDVANEILTQLYQSWPV
ncbi:MAG: lipoprotein-34 precursor (NlpB) [Acinetobacter sp.]|nr:lipoprotein-34 precursor (NlpB) [Acinetobacter sp.]